LTCAFSWSESRDGNDGYASFSGFNYLKLNHMFLTQKRCSRTFPGLLLGCILALVPFLRASAQNDTVLIAPDIKKQTFPFARKDSLELLLDVYSRPGFPPGRPCVIFVFGGGFMAGSRDKVAYNPYFNALVDSQYVVVSISYRLGLKGGGKLSALNLKPLKNAINLAVEDLYDATNWVLQHTGELGIDPGKIILSGSSAGAVTVLQAEYEKRNGGKIAGVLPADFQYAGVVSFSGAILRFDGGLKYRTPPAPTMLFHGTEDQLVFYNKKRFLNKGFYGSNHIASVFRKSGYPYYMFRVEGMGHEISETPMRGQLREIMGFLNDFVMEKKPYMIDETFKDPTQKRTFLMNSKDVYK